MAIIENNMDNLTFETKFQWAKKDSNRSVIWIKKLSLLFFISGCCELLLGREFLEVRVVYILVVV